MPCSACKVLAPHISYATNTYAGWAKERGTGETRYQEVTSIEDLKAMDHIKVLTPDACFEYLKEMGPDTRVTFHALLGGLDPEVSWRSLRLFESDVLPRLVSEGLVNLKK